MFFNNILVSILIFPIVGIIVLLCISSNKKKLLKITALNFACFSFISSLLMWGFFQRHINTFQSIIKFFWLPVLNLNCTIGIDGISLFFIVLTTFLVSLCLLASWNSIDKNLKEFLIAFLCLDFFLIGAFCALDLLLFYVFLKLLWFRWGGY